jgi:DNA-binding transcriptional LysR family regulator
MAREITTMEMHQVRYFLAVCETLNFTRAAEACNVTQPALTRAIQQLEEELGGLMIRRERGHTHLTDLGLLMQPHLARMLGEANAARSAAHGFLKLQAAPVKVGVMCTLGPMRFVKFLAIFREKYPGIEISLHEAGRSRLNEQLAAGEVDLALMAQPDPYEERYDVRPLYREHFVVAFSPGHRFDHQNAVRIADLAGEPYLTRVHCEYLEYLDGLCVQSGFKVNVAYRSEREDWIQSMVLAGLGVCFMPEHLPYIPGIQTRRVAEPDVVRAVSLVTVSGRRFSPAIAAFLDAVRRYDWKREMEND